MPTAGRCNGVRLATLATLVSLVGCAGVRERAKPSGGGAGAGGSGPPLPCIDLDGDGYGRNCPLGPDCYDGYSTSTCTGTIIIDPGWVPTSDRGAPDVFVPPAVETPTCPSGTRRIHVKNLWSKDVDPTLGLFATPPLAVAVADVTHNWLVHNARKDAAGCDWYSDCLPTTTTTVTVAAIDPTSGCVGNPTSGNIDLSQLPSTAELYIDYGGASATLPADYNRGNLRVTRTIRPARASPSARRGSPTLRPPPASRRSTSAGPGPTRPRPISPAPPARH